MPASAVPPLQAPSTSPNMARIISSFMWFTRLRFSNHLTPSSPLEGQVEFALEESPDRWSGKLSPRSLTRTSGLGCVKTASELSDELVKAGVVGALQIELESPRGRFDRLILVFDW